MRVSSSLARVVPWSVAHDNLLARPDHDDDEQDGDRGGGGARLRAGCGSCRDQVGAPQADRDEGRAGEARMAEVRRLQVDRQKSGRRMRRRYDSRSESATEHASRARSIAATSARSAGRVAAWVQSVRCTLSSPVRPRWISSHNSGGSGAHTLVTSRAPL